jgi:hypothetical protein
MQGGLQTSHNPYLSVVSPDQAGGDVQLLALDATGLQPTARLSISGSGETGRGGYNIWQKCGDMASCGGLQLRAGTIEQCLA